MSKQFYKGVFAVLLVVWAITTAFVGLEALGLHIAGYALHLTPEEYIVLLIATLAALMTISHST